MPALDCIKPFVRGGFAFRCGQCMPCRIHRQAVWKGRLLLEAGEHRSSLFVTLTYSPENIPHDGSVTVRELQLFFKRLRALNAGADLRYYAVGEYGERSGRPHYHLLLFGDVVAGSIEKAWGLGFVHIGLCTPESIGYCLGYMSKNKADRPAGVGPEFARMSKNPAIGKRSALNIARALQSSSQGALAFKALDGDAPVVYRCAGKINVLGRYLRNVIRKELGMLPREPEHVAAKRGGESWDREAWLRRKESIKAQADARRRIESSKRVI